MAVALTFAAVALAFALPWLPEGTPGGSELERYLPDLESDSRLSLVRAGGGAIEGWETSTTARIPPSLTSGRLPAGARDAIRAFYARGGEDLVPLGELTDRLDGVQILPSRTTRLDPADPARLQPEQLTVLLREQRGLLLITQRNAESGQELVLDPPAQLLPSGLRPGQHWGSRGKLGPQPYVLTASAGPRGSYRGPLGAFDDCLTVDRRLTVGTGTDQADSHVMERRCAGVGVVESRVLDAAGRLASSTVTIGTDGKGTRAGAPPAVALPDHARLTDPGGWQLERIGIVPTAVGSGSTYSFAPVYLGGDPPTVLAATTTGELFAQDAAGTGEVRWRFQAGGPIFGAPAIDRGRGRIYFGATDRRLYALDARGLFLWSQRTGDNVASRPAVAGETVVFGSEDRSVYGLDADTGARLWRVTTGGPVVSGPAVIGSTVVIGSDDGSVYGLDPRAGDERWRRKLGGAVEAPIVAEADVAYAVSRRGVVAALAAQDGTVRWMRDLRTTAPGTSDASRPDSDPANALRTAPTVGGDLLLVVSVDGTLTALDRETGRERWSVRGRNFVGPPVVAGAGVIAASEDGLVRLLDFSGRERQRWSARDALEGTALLLGPTLGGGSAWLGNARAVVRLGPPGMSESTTPSRKPGR